MSEKIFHNSLLNECYYRYHNLHHNSSVDDIQLSQHGDITVGWKHFAELVGRNLKPNRVRLFETIIKILNKYQIPYFLSDGSALGCYRNGKVIPHDVDIDITISEENIQRVIEIFKNEIKYGKTLSMDNIIIQTTDSYSKIDWESNSNNFINLSSDYESIVKKICIRYTGDLVDAGKYKMLPDLFAVVIDIYTYRCFHDHIYINYKHKDANLSIIGHPLDNIFPLQETKFENITVLTVANLKGYLERLYGYIGTDYCWDKEKQRFVKLE